MKRLSLFFIMMFCAVSFASDLPAIAVYVTGDMSGTEKEMLGTFIQRTFVSSRRYTGIEDNAAFHAKVNESVKGDAADNGMISKSGKESGANLVCIVDVASVFDFFSIAARVIDVETNEVVFIGEVTNPLTTAEDVKQASTRLVRNMITGQPASAPRAERASKTAAASTAPAAGAPADPEPSGKTPPPASAAGAPVLPTSDVSDPIIDRTVTPAPAAPVAAAPPAPRPVAPVAVAPPAPRPAAPVAVAPPAPIPAAPQAVWPPKAAVYITGLNPLLGNALSKAVSSALMKAKIYKGIESIDQHITGTPSDNQIIQAGKKAGVHFVFVINVSGQVNVRIIDVDLAAEMAKISLDGKMSSPIDAGKMAASIVNFIIKAGPKPPPGYTPPAPAPAPVASSGRPAGGAAESGRGQFDEPVVFGKKYPKNSIGVSLGSTGTEYHLRVGIGENSRIYSGFGWWSGKTYSDDWGREIHFTGFMEWHTNNDIINFYGGPGAALGFYYYKYSDHHFNDGFGYSEYSKDDGQGLILGVQGGAELRLGWFLIGCEMRLGYYMRWDYGLTGAIGVRAGIAF